MRPSTKLYFFSFLLFATAKFSFAYVRGCYYTNWAQYRTDKAKFTPENYQPGLCSHIFYAFAIMNPDFTLKTFEWNDEANYKKINDFKLQQADLKTLLSFGGYTYSEQNKALLKSMASTSANRNTFIDSALNFVKKYNFNGFDMDWEYPDAEDKTNYALLMKELATKFHANNLLVTAAVSAFPKNIEAGYDVPSLAQSLDLLNVMSYDLHGSGWQKITGFNSPLYDNGDNMSTKVAVDYWVSKGMPKSKINVGMATYGRTWTLTNPAQYNVGASGTPGTAGTYTKEAGILSYFETIDILNAGGKRFFDDVQKVPYVVKGDQWIGYDDKQSFNVKLDWIKSQGFAGAFIWTLDMDDFTGLSSNGEKYPLLKTINQALSGGTSNVVASSIATTSTTAKPTTVIQVTSSSSSSTSTTSAQKPAQGFVCPSAGIFANPASCTSFYNCDSALIAHLSLCPSGLQFNKVTKNCDWPANVIC